MSISSEDDAVSFHRTHGHGMNMNDVLKQQLPSNITRLEIASGDAASALAWLQIFSGLVASQFITLLGTQFSRE